MDFGAGGIFGWIGRLVDAQYEQPLVLTSQPVTTPEPTANPNLSVDEGRRCLVLDGVDISLTPLQYELLCHLMKNAERVLSRDELVQFVWQRPFVGSNVVDAAIRSLRKKLGERADAIETVKGFGYRFHVR